MRKPIKLTDGGDADFERQIFETARDYDRLKDIVRQKWYSGATANGESAWFQGILEFLYIKGFDITPRETGKVLPFKK